MKKAAIYIVTLLLAACWGEPEEPGELGLDSHSPVEVVYTEGHPSPGILAEEQTLHRGNGDEPGTLDPHLASGVPASSILRDLYEGLTGEDRDGRIIPAAAQRWNISRDGMVYTFHLRRDGKWSNGDPVTAGDFVFGFRRVADPLTASDYVHVLTPIENAPGVIAGDLPPYNLGVVALDEWTVQIKLSAPTPYFLGLLTLPATYPIHQASYQDYGSEFSRPGKMVSNGAFQLKDWVVRSHILIEKNPHYWDAEKVILEEVHYHGIEDQSTELKRYRAGELQWTNEVPSNLFQWLQTNMSAELVVSPWLGSYFIGFNLTKPPFEGNLNLRRALAMAVDRELLTQKITRFGELPAYSFVPPGMESYTPQTPEWAALSREEQLEEAKRLYQAAGYSDGNPLKVEIRYNTGENNKKVALAVAAMWKQTLGVEAILINEEWKVFLQNRAQKAVTQVFRAGWISDYNDPFSFLELLHSEHGRNDYGYNNESYDLLLASVATERIPARRTRLMEAAERMMLEDQPVVPLYTYVTKRLVKPTLKGWENNIMDHHYSKHMFFVKTAAEATAEGEPLEDLAESPEQENPGETIE